MTKTIVGWIFACLIAITILFPPHEQTGWGKVPGTRTSNYLNISESWVFRGIWLEGYEDYKSRNGEFEYHYKWERMTGEWLMILGFSVLSGFFSVIFIKSSDPPEG